MATRCRKAACVGDLFALALNSIDLLLDKVFDTWIGGQLVESMAAGALCTVCSCAMADHCIVLVVTLATFTRTPNSSLLLWLHLRVLLTSAIHDVLWHVKLRLGGVLCAVHLHGLLHSRS